MDLSQIKRGELIAAVGGLLLAVGVFVKWYEPRPESPHASIDGMRGVLSAWDVHDILRWILLAAAVAPFVLLWIIVRGHRLSWPRGELTAVLGIAALGFVFYSGIVDRPGEPSGQIELEIGWYIALLGTILMVVGGTIRAGESERRRKPPGVV